MPFILIASRQPLAGKTAVAVGLAQRLHQDGRRVSLFRLEGDDPGATADARLFASLPVGAPGTSQPVARKAAADLLRGQEFALGEAPAGDPAPALRTLTARLVLVAPYWELADEQLPPFCRSLGDSFLGLVATAVPARRLQAARQAVSDAGLSVLALLPEDRTLASPSVAEVAAALDAHPLFLNRQTEEVLDRILISSISADPGQGYFARHRPKAVIVRSDKPDLHLAALNAGVPCLILTGGLQPLSYVLERAKDEEVPILITKQDTIAAVQVLQGLYGRTRFTGQAKIERIGQLMAEHLDLEGFIRGL